MRHLMFGTERYALPILRPVAAALRARGDEVRWYLHGIDPGILRADEIALEGPVQVRAFAPHVVHAASNWVPPFFPGIKVQLFHGFNVAKRSASSGHFRMRGLFDLYCTQGPQTTAPFAALAARHRHFRVTETGWPKLDPLFAPHDGGAAALRAPALGRPVIGFGSTFTTRLSAAPLVLPELTRLIARGDRYWLLTLHPKSDPALVAAYRALAGPNAQFVETEDQLALLRAADVLLADTSSIVSEFAVQRRPVVTVRNHSPQPHMLDVAGPDAIDDALRHALAPPESLLAALARYADAIHPYRDGRSSERVLVAVDAFRNEGLTRKPVNALRRLQIRRRMGYWGW